MLETIYYIIKTILKKILWIWIFQSSFLMRQNKQKQSFGWEKKNNGFWICVLIVCIETFPKNPLRIFHIEHRRNNALCTLLCEKLFPVRLLGCKETYKDLQVAFRNVSQISERWMNKVGGFGFGRRTKVANVRDNNAYTVRENWRTIKYYTCK